MRKIAVITGTRAEYGRFITIMKAIQQTSDMELSVIATGMHLMPEFGYTVNEIVKDGFHVEAKVDMHISNDSGAGMAKSLGLGLLGITQAIESISPDILLILGDRGEALAAAIAGAHMNIPVAHIHGGEVTGTIDESIRHAITKFSHIHFAATEDSKERIIKLGEKPENVFNVGSPGLDSILNRRFRLRKEIISSYGFNPEEKVVIVAQHPVTTEIGESAFQMNQTMEAIVDLQEQTILIYPNADAGGRNMIAEISKYINYPFIKAFKNVPYEEYLDLLSCADVIVGNSSSAIMEAPSFKLPAVNIGTRQQGRERATNLLEVSHNKDEIRDAIQKALYDDSFRKQVENSINPYGDGKSGQRIASILVSIELSRELIQKRITY